ncbi:MAG: LytTR family transcriptional regulator DNA-binding domain-containing protein [Burkholderiaceae bacterium]
MHRGRIVNLHRVISADRDETGKIQLTLRGRADRPLVSRVFAHLFRPMLTGALRRHGSQAPDRGSVSCRSARGGRAPRSGARGEPK